MKLDKEQKKELRNLIVAYAKKLGYKARQNTIFRVKDAAMVYCDFLVVDSKKLIYRVNIKNYDYDDIFWKIMQMPSNSKEPDSLRAVGAFQAPTITVKTGQMELTDQYEEQAKILVELVEESSNKFMEQYDIDEYAINCQGEMYINDVTLYQLEGSLNGVCTCQQILDTKYKKIVSYIVRLYTPYATLDIAPRNSGQIIPTV